MLRLLTDPTQSLSNIVSVAFLFVCVFIIYRVFSRPEFKKFLKRGGLLPFIVAILIAGSWVYASFSFLISDGFFLLQRLLQSSFGISEVVQLFKDLTAIVVFGLGSYLIFRSYHTGPGQSVGKSGLLGLILVAFLLVLSACSSKMGDVWQQARDFIGTDDWIVYNYLSAMAYLIAGFMAYRVINTSLVNLPLRKLGLIPHILVFYVLTGMLFTFIYRPVYYFFDFMQGIANQDSFLPVFSNILCAVLFVVGYVLTVYLVESDDKHNPADLTN